MFLPLRIYALYIYSIFPPYPIGRISPCDTRGFLDPPSVQEVAEKAKELDHTDAGSGSVLKNLVVFLGTFGGMKSYPVIWGLFHKPLYNVIYIHIVIYLYIYIHKRIHIEEPGFNGMYFLFAWLNFPTGR